MNKKDLTKLSVLEDSPFLKYSWDEFTSWALGKILVSIGEGTLSDTFNRMLRFAGDWAIYNR